MTTSQRSRRARRVAVLFVDEGAELRVETCASGGRTRVRGTFRDARQAERFRELLSGALAVHHGVRQAALETVDGAAVVRASIALTTSRSKPRLEALSRFLEGVATGLALRPLPSRLHLV